jgi:RHS repeat-associated protein
MKLTAASTSKTPTFGEDLWVTRTALESEASGYFLVPEENRDEGWREVSLAEASEVRGRGYTGNHDPKGTRPDDNKTKPECKDKGMCDYNIHEMLVSLNLQDTPVGYAPPKGPAAYVTLTYNQREASQPATFSHFNVSPKWNLNWLSFIEDDPMMAGAGSSSVMHHVAGGGSTNYSDMNPNTKNFAVDKRDASSLAAITLNPIKYQRSLSDGSVEVYGHSDGATQFPRRVFLTQIIDPSGNAMTLNYDSALRLKSLTDATGRDTTFSYDLPSRPMLITRITDPFGRTAQITYDSTGHLSEITDVIGLKSTFGYDASSQIDTMITPYGTTKFAYGEYSNPDHLQEAPRRFLEITDPAGYKERVEFRHRAPGITDSDPAGVPQGILAPQLDTPRKLYLDARNTFYWDKHAFHAFQVAPNDYTKARIKHWAHVYPNQPNNPITSNVIESIKFPLENRVWMNYPGQSSLWGGALQGILNKPSAVGRVLDDGSTQLTQFTYNGSGNVTKRIDPRGRETSFEYYPNQIDLSRVQQKTSAAASGFSTIAEFTYNSQHLPKTYNDAAGQTTKYDYNSAGQITQATDPLGHITKYEYDNLGYLKWILNPNQKTAVSFTYDAFSRVETRTDSEGHVIKFDYDALDRLTTETYPDGTTRVFTWDKLDLIDVKDRQSRHTAYGYDYTRNLRQITDPVGGLTGIDYHENGRLKNIVDPNGHVTMWDIDVQGRVIEKVHTGGSKITNTYEATTSRLKAIKDPLGQTKQYTYSSDNRLAGIEYLNAQIKTPAVHFSDDLFFPRVATMTDGGGTTTYEYVPVGALGALKLRKEDGPYTSDAISYTYDELGRVIRRDVDASAESFTYDSLGRLDSHTSPLGVFKHSYLGETGQLTSGNIPGGNIRTDWTYDTNTNGRRLKTITSSGVSRAYQYTTTPENLIKQIIESASAGAAQTWDYGYDDADRLLQGRSSSGAQYDYTYDKADNITSWGKLDVMSAKYYGATYNSLNQISYSNYYFVYDANGNVTDDGFRTYKWDAENRLVGIIDKARPRFFSETTIRYDGLGRRNAIVTPRGTGKGLFGTEIRYLWCGAALCQARTNGDVVSRRYYPEGELIVGSGTQLYYAKDHLGSVRDVLDIQNGNNVASYDYDPYGNPSQTAGTMSTDFRYAGMFYHQDSGLYLTYYRAYDPRLGRWLSRDPIAETSRWMANDSLFGIIRRNLYAYVRDNPTNLSDLYGLADGGTTTTISVTEGGNRTGPTYGATIIVNLPDAGTQTLSGSSWPNATNSNPGVASGTYSATYSSTGHHGTSPGVRLNNGGAVSTVGNQPNPAQDGGPFSTGINIHCGASATNCGSAGCITVNPVDAGCDHLFNSLSPGQVTVIITRSTPDSGSPDSGTP